MMTEEEAYRKMISTIIGCYNTTRLAHVSAVDHVASKSVVRADAELYAISRYGKPIPAARFTREDVEKAAEGIAQEDGVPWIELPYRVKLWYQSKATAALSVIGEVDHG